MARAARRFAANSGPIWALLYQNEAVDHGAVGANTTLDTDITIADAAVGDVPVGTYRTAFGAGIVDGGWRVKAAGTVTSRLGNLTAAPIDPAANVADIYLLR